VGALTVLQAALYHCPESAFSAHAEARAEAKLLRDTRADAGGITAEDWCRIGSLPDHSWGSVQTALTPHCTAGFKASQSLIDCTPHEKPA